MFEIQNYASFVMAVLVFQLIPGPGTLAILNATARHGSRAGMAAVLGTLLGDFVYMVAAIAGLAAVMQTLPGLFHALQWLGAAYLTWIGIGLLRRETPTVRAEQATATHLRQAFAVGLTNPKVMLFFVAFFPLFLRPDASALTLGAMMAHVTLISLAYQTGLVLLGGAVARRLAGWPGGRQLARRLCGIALIGFGIRLALNQR
jgi:leucine efflux protein